MADKKEKRVYAPNYYKKFKCIAEKCRHNCCIGWEICIDGEALEKYREIKHIFDTVRECGDGPCFALREDGCCPHLNEYGLCNIIISHGEGYLSEICRKHPRFYNHINNERIEAGLGLACEEACRLILENQACFSLCGAERLDCRDSYDFNEEFNALSYRGCIISKMEAEGDFDTKLSAIKTEFGISESYAPDKWLDIFLSLEIFDSDWERDLRAMRGSFLRKSNGCSGKYGKYYERLLTYFIYRHVSVADSLEDLRARLAFAILSVSVIRSLFENSSNKGLEVLADWARRYSAEIEYSEENTQALIFEAAPF